MCKPRAMTPWSCFHVAAHSVWLAPSSSRSFSSHPCPPALVLFPGPDAINTVSRKSGLIFFLLLSPGFSYLWQDSRTFHWLFSLPLPFGDRSCSFKPLLSQEKSLLKYSMQLTRNFIATSLDLLPYSHSQQSSWSISIQLRQVTIILGPGFLLEDF